MLIDITDTVQLTHTAAEVDADIDGSVRGDIEQLKDDIWKEQARENIGAGSGAGGSRNLLDNWWFGKGVVNQRGQTVYQGGRYCIDRWIIDNNNASVTVTLTDDGIIFARTGTAVHASFAQKFDTALPKITPGQTATLSAIIDGELKSVTFAYPSNEIKVATWGLIDVYVSPLQVNFYVPASRGAFSYLIKCAEVAPGEESTLENALPPDYTTELLKCMRYFVRVNGGNYVPLGVGANFSTTQARIGIALPVPMRAYPSTITMGGSSFYIISEGSSHSVTSVERHGNVSTPNSTMLVKCNVGSGLTSNKLSMLVNQSDTLAYIDFSADL